MTNSLLREGENGAHGRAARLMLAVAFAVAVAVAVAMAAVIVTVVAAVVTPILTAVTTTVDAVCDDGDRSDGCGCSGDGRRADHSSAACPSCCHGHVSSPL